jgi:dihydrofolate synthase/folylpolyglutamate synthase
VVAIDDAAIARVPPVGLAGAHQRRNAAAAVAAIDALEARGVIRVSADTRAAALATVVHPGRFEILDGAPRTILDGAHNPHGATALAETVRARGERPVVVVAISADKDARAIAAPLATIASAVIATRYQQDRALAPADLAGAFAAVAPGVPVETAPDLVDALARARARAGQGGTVLVTGSLFLVGEARVLLVGAPADPVVLSDPARLG